jgi:hypothetical protein
MKFDIAKQVLLRRQAHLLARFTKSNKNLSYDKQESDAISSVLFEVQKLQAKVDTYESNMKGKENGKSRKL